MSVKFYLGVSNPSWLSHQRLSGIPLFISRNTIGKRRSLPVAITDFALDSGGFTEISKHGKWVATVQEYTDLVLRLKSHYGSRLRWVAQQDWMCEPHMLVKTGMSVQQHQRLTVDNFIDLRSRLGQLVVPSLQGWKVSEYMDCYRMYQDSGVDLLNEPLVCVGSVCRRQSTDEASEIITTLAATGMRLHGFGFKKQGIVKCKNSLTSADSMAWSLSGRYRPNLSHPHIARSKEPDAFRKRGCSDDCANCLDYAIEWHNNLIQECQ